MSMNITFLTRDEFITYSANSVYDFSNQYAICRSLYCCLNSGVPFSCITSISSYDYDGGPQRNPFDNRYSDLLLWECRCELVYTDENLYAGYNKTYKTLISCLHLTWFWPGLIYLGLLCREVPRYWLTFAFTLAAGISGVKYEQEVQGPWRSAWQLQLGWHWQFSADLYQKLTAAD